MNPLRKFGPQPAIRLGLFPRERLSRMYTSTPATPYRLTNAEAAALERDELAELATLFMWQSGDRMLVVTLTPAGERALDALLERG